MSRGPGRIERALAAIFDSERDNAFTLEDLRERVYPEADETEKKHRVALTRAARNLVRRRPEIHCMRGKSLGGAVVFFRHDEVMSYAMARLKSDNLERYRDKNPQLYWNKNEDDLRRRLADDRHRELVAPGGSWWRHVQQFLAEQVGDFETVARLKAEGRAALAATLGRIRGR